MCAPHVGCVHRAVLIYAVIVRHSDKGAGVLDCFAFRFLPPETSSYVSFAKCFPATLVYAYLLSLRTVPGYGADKVISGVKAGCDTYGATKLAFSVKLH